MVRFATSRYVLPALACFASFASIAVIGDTFIEDNNFRLVNQSVFRSGQLRSDEWDESYGEHRYRSVLNLRGVNAGQPWYDLEMRFAAEHDIQHYDFPLSAKIAPTDLEMEGLLDIITKAPKPLLIHCNSGADRTGLASALYVYAVEGASAEQAKKQLSLWYGHFPWLASRTGAMDRAFEAYIADHSPKLTSTAWPRHREGRRWPT